MEYGDYVRHLPLLKASLNEGVALLTSLIISDYYELAIDLVKRNPMLASWQNVWENSALVVLAKNSKAFSYGSRFGRFKHLLIQFNKLAASHYDDDGKTMLHLAGKLAPPNKISGAALQMQRELQWFKEVEKIVQPGFKEMKNDNGKTPRMVFTEEHKDLLEKGEKWMKDTAISCATVAALIVTVMFTAAFTVPGGNNGDKGIPILLNDTSFLIFAISDALGLVSSSTSLLMFLGILISRCAEDDFLRALPIRMSIGLISLFLSIASMLGAFCAAFYLVMSERVTWIGVPIGLVACVPVVLFALLQFPLLVEITYSTFGPSIFQKKHQKFIF
ncbi:Ankyrin repeat family protein [Euphorbia peplus]|nr:Ankyrin repeat family protein [Euphorbia peplus]